MRAVSCIIAGVISRLVFAPGSCCRSGLRRALFAVCGLIAFDPLAAFARSSPAAAQHTTVVVFSDHHMPAEQWDTLVADLRSGLSSGDPETLPLDASAEFVRGDRLSSGLEVDSAITVFLHGDCDLAPLTRHATYGAPLGWVRRVNGQIEPFVHVDCNEIGRVLGGQTRWLGKQARSQAMTGAIARVVLHEWIHIVTQNPHHAANGVAKAQFGVNDLIDDDERMPAGTGSGR
jgi:hypothetical protein